MLRRFIFIFLIVFLLIGIYLYLKKKPIAFEEFIKKTPENIKLEFKDINLAGWDGEKKQWEIESEKVIVDRSEEITKFKEIKKGIFFKENRPVIHFKAMEGVYNSRTRNLQIDGKINICHTDGISLITDRLLFIGSENKLKIPCGFLLNHRKNSISGRSLIADTNLEEVEIKGDVSAKFEVEE